MKIITNIFALLLLFAFVSCTRDNRSTIDSEILPPPPQGMVRVEVSTETGEYQTPTTRATANESAIDNTPWIIVFDGNDYNATFVEAVQATAGTGVSAGKSIAILTASATPRMLLVVANASNFIQARKSSLVSTTTLTAAQTTLLFGLPALGTTPLSNPQTTLPYVSPSALAIPKSRILSLPSLTSLSKIAEADGSPLMLSRITAKVTVDASAVPSTNQFALTGVTVISVPRSGSLIQPKDAASSSILDNTVNLCDYRSAANTPIVTGTDIASNNSTNSPIYVYESRETSSSIIIQGTYKGVSYYYRLPFVNPDNTARIDIKRNHSYIFKVQSVKAPGYSTMNEAITNKPSTDVDYGILVSDDSSYDIITNGSYYLALSNSEVLIWDSGTASLVINNIVTVTTNATISQVPTTQNSISSATTIGPGLFGINNSGTASKLTLSLDGVLPATTTINLASMNNLFDATSTGSFSVKLGNLTKVITVKRRPYLIGPGFEEVPGASNFTAGKFETTGGISGMGFSSDGTAQKPVQEFTADNPGAAQLVAPANKGTTIKSGGVAYISRDDNGGRIKMFINQDFMTAPIIDQYKDGVIDIYGGRYAYVGAYWRSNEVGERLIAMQNTTNTNWMVEIGDNLDWIEIDTNYPAMLPNDDHPSQSSPIGGGLKTVSGTGTNINFRIGLKSANPFSQPRYGVIYVYYNNKTKIHPIFIRQGEQADYIGGPQNVSGAKWLPYNLGNRQAPSEFNNNGLTAYPSQGGYLYQWSGKGTAYTPVAPLSPAWTNEGGGSTSMLNVCPDGYHVPNADGSITWKTNNEFGALYNTGGAAGTNIATQWGYYADGFFDRRTITDVLTYQGGTSGSIVQNNRLSGVLASSNNGAYLGQLVYNTDTNSSIFIPASGHIDPNAKVTSKGAASYLWTSSISGTQPYRWAAANKLFTYVVTVLPNHGFVVRCVADNPEYPPFHRGWAGSNIYWDAANNKLTFDDVNVTTHEQYQGLHFKYGSLVAISTVGGSDATVSREIIYNPTGVADYGSYNAIPYISTYTVNALGTDANRAYVYVNHDPVNGKGDICRYMTEMGWAPAGKKWRLPTTKEIGVVADWTTVVGTFASVDGVTRSKYGAYPIPSGRRYSKSGVTGTPFFPSCGYHRWDSGGLMGTAGEYGNYTTGSPSNGYPTTSGGNFYFDKTTMTPTSGVAFNAAQSVRCVAL